MVFLVVAAVPLALLGALGWARPSRTEHGTELLLAMLLGGVVAYSLATTALGDGLSEAARHFIPGSLAVFAAWIAFFFAIPELAMRWKESPKERALEMAGFVFALAALGVATWYSAGWARAQALAIGTMDEPSGRLLTPGAPLSIHGWAIDPSGVDSVTVELGKYRREITQFEASPKVKRTFPGYPDADTAGFSLTISPAELASAGAPEPMALRVIVKSRAGPSTEVDRRRIEFRSP
jgi:hypothetical protein